MNMADDGGTGLDYNYLAQQFDVTRNRITEATNNIKDKITKEISDKIDESRDLIMKQAEQFSKIITDNQTALFNAQKYYFEVLNATMSDITGATAEIEAKIQQGFEDTLQSLQSKFDAITKDFEDKINSVTNKLQDIQNNIGEKITESTTAITKTITITAEMTQTKISEVGTAVENAKNSLSADIFTSTKSIIDNIYENVTTLYANLKRKFDEISTQVKQQFDNTINFIESGFSTMTEGFFEVGQMFVSGLSAGFVQLSTDLLSMFTVDTDKANDLLKQFQEMSQKYMSQLKTGG